jgi:hypothetical protein
MQNKLVSLGLVALFIGLAGGCKKVNSPAMPVPSGTSSGQRVQAAGVLTTTTEYYLLWTIPKGWTIGPEKLMLAASYSFGLQRGDADSGTCVVYHFPRNSVGGIDSDIARWADQFDRQERPKREDKEMNGLRITRVEIVGTYTIGDVKKPDYRLLGAIVYAPEGQFLFKLVGPANTVIAASADFDSMINSLHRSSKPRHYQLLADTTRYWTPPQPSSGESDSILSAIWRMKTGSYTFVVKLIFE